MNYPKVAHLPQNERFGALAALRDRLAATGQYQKRYSPSSYGRHASPRHCNRLPAKKCKADQDCSWIKRSPSHRAYCRRQGGFLVPAYKRRSRFVGTARIPAVYLAAASKVLAPQLAAAVGVPKAPPMVAETPLATLLAPGIPNAPPLTTDKDIIAAAVDDANAGFCSRFSQGDCQKHFRCSWDDAARICRLADKARELKPVSDRFAATAAQRRDDEYLLQGKGILGVNPLRKERPNDFMDYLGDMSAKAISPRKQADTWADYLGGPLVSETRPRVCSDYLNAKDCNADDKCFFDDEAKLCTRALDRKVRAVPAIAGPDEAEMAREFELGRQRKKQRRQRK